MLAFWLSFPPFSIILPPVEIKPRLRGNKNMLKLPGRSPLWMVKSQTTRLWWSSAGEPFVINNFLREITKVCTCVVIFSHPFLITEKEEGWWKTDNVLGIRARVAQCVFRHSRNPCTNINFQRHKMPQHQCHVQCMGEPQCQLKYSTASRCLYYSRHT